MTMARMASPGGRLEVAVDQWVAKKSQQALSELRRELSLPESLAARAERIEQELSHLATVTESQLATLLALPAGERNAWIEQHVWQADGALLAEAILDAVETRPDEDPLQLARMAARVASRTAITPEDTLYLARLDEIFGRAGLLEVRVLRRRGELALARRRFAELDVLLEIDDTPLRFWLTLEADRCLTAALLARDENRLTAATDLLRRTSHLLRVAGSEEEDFELLAAQVRTDLVRGLATQALAHFGAGRPAITCPRRRLELGALEVAAALRTRSPLLARRALLGLGGELLNCPHPSFEDRYRLLEAAVEVAETQPNKALETLAPAAGRLRAAGCLVGSLQAAVVAARAELDRENPEAARVALAAGPLAAFHDLPATPAVVDACAQVVTHASAGVPREDFLARLELWLLLVVDSPGLELA